MLNLTDEGFRRSVGKHNCNDEIVSDWIIANVMLHEDGEISKSDLIDVLLEQSIYNDDAPDYCAEYVNRVWRHTRDQILLLGDSAPVVFEHRSIKRTKKWSEAPAFTFFILLYLKKYISGWANQFGQDHSDQGELFEKVCFHSIEQQFQGFKVKLTGWSKNETTSFKDIVEDIALFLSEEPSPTDIAMFTSSRAKDLGLDLLWTKEVSDSRGACMTSLAQCASGHDLKSKLKTPDISTWSKVIHWKSPPRKAFMTPFALSNSDYTVHSSTSEGDMFDRYRILVQNKEENEWLEKDVMDSLVDWLNPRVTWLQTQTM